MNKITEERFLELMEEDTADIKNIPDNAMEGLLVIQRYMPDKCILQGAQHDIIYGPNIDDLIEAGIIEDDVKYLRRMNWHVEDDTYLSCFV